MTIVGPSVPTQTSTLPSFDAGDGVRQALQPPEPGGTDINELVQSAGWGVTAVDWLFEQVTGESLVEMIIMPITGDYRKIAADGNAWRTVSTAMSSFSDTMSANTDALRDSWKGPAAFAHEAYVDYGWKAGFVVEGKIAETIAKGFDKVAEGSERLCKKALELLDKLVKKLIEAAAQIWVPLAGWIAAAEKVWAAYNIYKMIMEIIEMVKQIIQAVKEIFESIQSIGSQLAKIKDIRSIDDAMDIAKGVSKEAGDISGSVNKIQDNAKGIADTSKSIGKETQTVGKGVREAGDLVGGRTGERISSAGDRISSSGEKIETHSTTAGEHIDKVNKTVDDYQKRYVDDPKAKFDGGVEKVEGYQQKVNDGLDSAGRVIDTIDQTDLADGAVEDVRRTSDVIRDRIG